jgi:hypothetical protein
LLVVLIFIIFEQLIKNFKPMNTEKSKFIQGKIHLIEIFTIALTLFAMNAKSQSCGSPTNNHHLTRILNVNMTP